MPINPVAVLSGMNASHRMRRFRSASLDAWNGKQPASMVYRHTPRHHMSTALHSIGPEGGHTQTDTHMQRHTSMISWLAPAKDTRSEPHSPSVVRLRQKQLRAHLLGNRQRNERQAKAESTMGLSTTSRNSQGSPLTYSTDPQTRSSFPPSRISQARPKSTIRSVLSPANMMFSSFKSRCTQLLVCMCCTPRATWGVSRMTT